jgi:hypothetical protein
MSIFGQYQGGDPFNVAGNMRDVLKGQQNVNDSMLQAVEKFNTARQDMEVLQKQTGAILSQYGVDEKGKPDDTAPKYVHDLFKAVNNEGGVANMSRSQMIAGIKAYETGFGVSAKELELQGAREGVRAKKTANDIAELQYKEALKAREEQTRIKEALKATEAAREAAKKELVTKDKKEVFSVPFEGETIQIKKEEYLPLQEALDNAENSKDEKEKPKLVKAAKQAIEKFLVSKSRVSKEYLDVEDTDPNRGMAFNETTGEWERKKNPFYKPDFVSAYDTKDTREYNLSKGEAPPESTFNYALLEGFISKESAKYRAAKKAEAEAKAVENTEDKSPLTILKRQIDKNKKDLGPLYEKGIGKVSSIVEELKSELALGMTPFEFNQAVTRAEFEIEKELGVNTQEISIGQQGDFDRSVSGRAYNQVKRDFDSIIGGMRSDMDFGFMTSKGWSQSRSDGFYIGVNALPPSKLIKLGKLSGPRDLNEGEVSPEQRAAAMERADKMLKAIKGKTEKSKVAETVKPYETGEFVASAGGRMAEVRNSKVEVVKSMEEQTDDEYAIMSNYFTANGGMPDSFSKEAFYRMKGIARPISISLGGGNRYVEYNGEKKIVQDVQGQGMSLADEERLWKAGEFAKSRNLNGVQANGFRFSGEVRVGDIDKANKVKEELFTSTRALASVDRMLEIAENASLFDKLLPTEISGIAQSLTNAAQSANRTEIGGSGAWSNQDQAYMDKVIRDPSSGFNAIFSTQAIASLKEYRSRLLAGMVDKGTAYGFAFERGGNNDGLDASLSQFRVRFNSALARNMTEQEALEYAKGTLYANGSE